MCETEEMGSSIDWRVAASQMLRALRGQRSQLAFSRRLHYRSNVACDWEAGRRLPTAAEALRACARVGIDVVAAFRAFQPACAESIRAPRGFQPDRWLTELLGSTSVSQLAARSGYSRYAIARWLQGKARPRLHDFLALVEAISGRASDLVHALVSIDAVAELRTVHQQRAAHRRVAFDAPWSEAVLRVMETTGYRKARGAPGYIARRLGLSQEDERRVLVQLEAAGAIARRGTEYLDLVPISVDTSGASTEDLQRLKAHWTQVSLQRLPAPRTDDWLGYNVISTSAADLERIREILRRSFREIRAIAAASEPAESVALLNLQLVTWNETEPQS
jgi:transcriptional regulator with XRE-family HTH domain